MSLDWFVAPVENLEFLSVQSTQPRLDTNMIIAYYSVFHLFKKKKCLATG